MTKMKKHRSTAVKFGAAMMTIYAAPQLHADIVNITPSISQLGVGASINLSLTTSGGGALGALNFSNDKNANFVHETFGSGAIGFCNIVTKTLHTSTNCTIVAASFTGEHELTMTQAGTRFLAFITESGNVGWFTLNQAEIGAPLFFTGGQYGTAGESLQVGFDDPLLGDVNLDGLVNLLDVSPFIDRISTGTFQAEADINVDGSVNLLDVQPFIDLLSG